MREQILAVLLLVAAAVITAGVARISTAWALILGGALMALWSWLIFGDVD